jgi:hypothetical protein
MEYDSKERKKEKKRENYQISASSLRMDTTIRLTRRIDTTAKYESRSDAWWQESTQIL